MLLFFVFFILKPEEVLGYSCDYGECSCVDDMVTCVDVTGPRFKFRATVTMLYMDNVQIINLVDILKKLPNLRYLTLMNMAYFDCEWIKDLPKHIYLKTNMCSKSSTTKRFQNQDFLTASETTKRFQNQDFLTASETTKRFQNQDFLTASESLTERNDKISTEVYEKSSTFLPLQTSTFNSVYSKKISYFSQEVHSNTPSKLGFSTSGRNLARNKVKSPFNKNKWRKILWIISVAVCLAVILLTIIAIIVCKRRARGQINDSDNTMLALSENLGMEESSLDCSK